MNNTAKQIVPDDIKAGCRVKSDEGREGSVRLVGGGAAIIDWPACGHCGVLPAQSVVPLRLLAERFRSGGWLLYPPPSGTFTGSRS